MTTAELRTVFCERGTHLRPLRFPRHDIADRGYVYVEHQVFGESVSDAARREWGSDAVVGMPFSKKTAPYDAAKYQIVGYVAAHRSGPACPVMLPR